MKTLKFLFLFLFCCSLSQLHAQWSIGVEGGYTNAWEEYGDVGLPEDAEIDVSGFNVSGLAYFQLSKHFKIGVEPGFIQRGAACVPGWQPIFEADTKLFLNYVEAPVMISGNIPLFKSKFEIFAKAGYGASYLTSAFREEMVVLPDGDVPVNRTKMELGEDSMLNRWDHGVYGSFGFGYNMGIHQIFVASDYYMGLTDAERFNQSENRNVNFNIGYMISL